MIAPCGVEIKVGQVWERGGKKYKVEDVCRYCRPIYLRGLSGHSFYAGTKNFTGKLGGYRLVKDVQQ